jgi:hypothetical protein
MFSKQKINLLKSKKVKSYISYAIGEILLIVIGISIAVYINDAVENNNQEKLLNTIFKTISSDLETDLQEVDIILQSYERFEPYFDYVLDSLDVGRSMKDCPNCPNVLTSAIPFSIRNRGYQQLLNYKAYNLENTDSLIFKVSNFYASYTKLTEIVNELILEDTNENLDYLKVNYPYFKDLFTTKENPNRMDFFENNIEFVNRVAMREVLDYSNHVQLLESYKKDAKDILDQIRNR